MRMEVELELRKLPIPNLCPGLPSTAATSWKARIQKERKIPSFASISLSCSHTYLNINKGPSHMVILSINIFSVSISMIQEQ